MNTQPELQGAAVGVFIIQDQDRGRWWNFGLPGVRIYLSAGFLRETEFENQVAAAIAMELAYVLRRDVVQRIEQNQALARQQPAFATDAAVAAPPAGSAESAAASPPPRAAMRRFPRRPSRSITPGRTGSSSSPRPTRLDAIELAVDILYKAGFDPRGLIELWKIYEDHQGARLSNRARSRSSPRVARGGRELRPASQSDREIGSLHRHPGKDQAPVKQQDEELCAEIRLVVDQLAKGEGEAQSWLAYAREEGPGSVRAEASGRCERSSLLSRFGRRPDLYPDEDRAVHRAGRGLSVPHGARASGALRRRRAGGARCRSRARLHSAGGPRRRDVASAGFRRSRAPRSSGISTSA